MLVLFCRLSSQAQQTVASQRRAARSAAGPIPLRRPVRSRALVQTGGCNGVRQRNGRPPCSGPSPRRRAAWRPHVEGPDAGDRRTPENRERSMPVFRDFSTPGFGNGLSAGQSLKCEEQPPLLGWLEQETDMSRKDKDTASICRLPQPKAVRSRPASVLQMGNNRPFARFCGSFKPHFRFRLQGVRIGARGCSRMLSKYGLDQRQKVRKEKRHDEHKANEFP